MSTKDKDVLLRHWRVIKCEDQAIVLLALLLLLLAASPEATAAVDLSGSWVQLIQEDAQDRTDGPALGDYTGLPLNEAARMRAEAWDAAKWSVPEHQCEPHPADYAPHGPAALRISNEVDESTQEIIAWDVTYVYMNSHRAIWMDGRKRPSVYAPHTWMGFSTGEWKGDALVVTTSHLKEGWIRRNGVPRSDRGTLVEYWFRHGNYLTVVGVIDDPVYLTAPFVRSWNWVLSLGFQVGRFGCEYRPDSALPKGFVAHHLPEDGSPVKDFSATTGLPLEAARGGLETLYPEYVDRLRELKRGNAGMAESRIGRYESATPKHRARPQHKKPQHQVMSDPFTDPLETLHVQRNIFMIAGAGANVTVQIGDDGVLIVDTKISKSSERVLAEIRAISRGKIRHVVNTSADIDHAGGNERIAAAENAGRPINATAEALSLSVRIYAHVNVLRDLSQQPRLPHEAWPTDAYFSDPQEVFFNGEAVVMEHEPAAHTDGDSIVYFRGSDVVSTGDIFMTTGYPAIDIGRGGSINGVIAALNRVIEIAVPKANEEGGTMVIPGHGRICDESDVVAYRDMVTIVRDRVNSMINRGMTLDEVQEKRPTMDYDGRYGAEDGPWTTRQFVEAVYRSLKATSSG